MRKSKMTKNYKYADTVFLNEIDIKQITVDGKELYTAPSTYKMFSKFLEKPRHLFTKKRIDIDILNLPYLEKENFRGSHSCYSYMSSLKNALEKIKPGLSDILVCKKGQGWYLKG